MNKKELITEQGYFTFVKEFKKLLEKEKPYWVKEKEIAAQLGDRSENAEYISAKEQIRNIDKRLRFLDRIIKTAQVINTYELPHTKVNFGSCVELLDINSDERKTFIIVGTYETKPIENKISNKSPLGKILLGKEVGDEFEFRINDNIFEYEVLSVKKYIFEKEE